MLAYAQIQEEVRLYANSLGCCGLGFTSLQSSPYAEYLHHWFETQQYGEMTYLARQPEMRMDPQKRFPWVKSVLMIAFPYGEEAVSTSDSSPLVARYARSQDYHSLLEQKLKKIRQFLDRYFPQAQFRAYVDTGPIMERELAQNAGLGFIGKNTLLIHRHQGSYFFLATLLTDISFQVDRPIDTSHCGTCTRCLDVCPTQALTPYQMDARKCISYLTIEKKGDLTPTEMEGLENQYFGCDLCQEVCPFNRRPFPFSSELKTPHPLASLTWEQILLLDEKTFEFLKPKSPLRRSKQAGLLRNAIVVLANLKEVRYFKDVVSHSRSLLPGVASAVDYFKKKFS